MCSDSENPIEERKKQEQIAQQIEYLTELMKLSGSKFAKICKDIPEAIDFYGLVALHSGSSITAEYMDNLTKLCHEFAIKTDDIKYFKAAVFYWKRYQELEKGKIAFSYYKYLASIYIRAYECEEITCKEQEDTLRQALSSLKSCIEDRITAAEYDEVIKLACKLGEYFGAIFVDEKSKARIPLNWKDHLLMVQWGLKRVEYIDIKKDKERLLWSILKSCNDLLKNLGQLSDAEQNPNQVDEEKIRKLRVKAQSKFAILDPSTRSSVISNLITEHIDSKEKVTIKICERLMALLTIHYEDSTDNKTQKEALDKMLKIYQATGKPGKLDGEENDQIFFLINVALKLAFFEENNLKLNQYYKQASTIYLNLKNKEDLKKSHFADIKNFAHHTYYNGCVNENK